MPSLRRLTPLVLLALLACAPSTDRTDEDQQATAEPLSAAEALLARSVGYHDPAGAWSSFQGTLGMEERRPDGSGRTADVTLDVSTGAMVYQTTRDGHQLIKKIGDGRCQASVDGVAPTDSESERYQLACEQMERSRNYYLFLWGLPMKLRDPGTRIEPEVERGNFEGKEVEVIRVTYDPTVGTDTWYFYFDPGSAALVGYRFYHNETENDGEYIVLDGETVVGSMNLPASRSWYVNADGEFLGEDVLVGGTAAN